LQYFFDVSAARFEHRRANSPSKFAPRASFAHEAHAPVGGGFRCRVEREIPP
jgi:hypothetical protein